eukprot:TRINITY_DN41914_c0_g1_i1.p1 TRINITY_DN41914_c0_g1~~TRINITY_DN41914_c0_g1_i1.p1  ORF type:complete len:611 (-),score=107.60 TRINITY_DN41914_c0_g1_i1:45-1877(-)
MDEHELLSMGERRLRAGALQCAHVVAVPHGKGFFGFTGTSSSSTSWTPPSSASSICTERHIILDTVQSEAVVICDGRVTRLPWTVFCDAHSSWRPVRIPASVSHARQVLRRTEALMGTTPAADTPEASGVEGLCFVDDCFKEVSHAAALEGHRVALHRLSSLEWKAYEERRARAPLKPAPCMLIAAPWQNGGGPKTLPEHHAILDLESNEVVHYTAPPSAEKRQAGAQNSTTTPSPTAPTEAFEDFVVRIEPVEDFMLSFPTWRVVELPRSSDHAREVIQRARSKVGERNYNLLSNNCEHFATWCFTGQEASNQVRSMMTQGTVGAAATSGVSYGMASSVTYTVTTPAYALGFIPWGTTTSTVGLSGLAVASSTAVGLGAGLAIAGATYMGVNALTRQSTEMLALKVPICVGNKTEDEELMVTIRNLDSMLSTPDLPIVGRLSAPRVDDIAHWTRTKRGIGSSQQSVAPRTLADINPPAIEACYERFELCLQARQRSAPESPQQPAGGNPAGSAAASAQEALPVLKEEPEQEEQQGGAEQPVERPRWFDYFRSRQGPSEAGYQDQQLPQQPANETADGGRESAWREVCRVEARRGDVFIYSGGDDVQQIS